jgi:hypothetical protein
LTSSVASVRIEGKNEPGVASKIASSLAGERINLRGFSTAVIGGRFISFLGFDSVEDADRAVEVIERL